MGPHVIIDTHVHIHKINDITTLLESTFNNFTDRASTFLNNEFVGVLFVYALKENDDIQSRFIIDESSKSWQFKQLDRNTFNASLGHKKILIKTGYQVISREGIEILVLTDNIKKLYGVDADLIIESALANNEIVIIPWGVGKWLGTRGEVVNGLIKKYGPRIFLGDNSSRPWFWKIIPQFKIARNFNTKVLNGTDPLPIHDEERIVGKFGVFCENVVSDELDLVNLLSTQKLVNYGKMESIYRFFLNQIKLRLN